MLRPVPMMRSAALALSVLFSASVLSGEVRLAGTDLLNPALSEALQQRIEEQGLAIRIDLRGSHPARQALLDGRIGAALLVGRPGEAPPAAPLVAVTIAYQSVVFAVSNENPLDQIHLAQLAGIFGADEGVQHRRWGELGLSDEWSSRAISPQAVSARGSLAHDFFRFSVLSGRPVRGTVIFHESTAAALERIRADRGSIALIPALPPEARGVKALSVAPTAADFAYSPTPDNVGRGRYPLALPVMLVVRPEAAEELRPLLRFFASQEMEDVARRAGLIPLSSDARARLAFELDRL
jgi:ABC-type phosphate transport system substrate-binding protein